LKTFDFNKIEDFDEHIRLSIPNYDFLFEQVKVLVEAFAEEECPVVDVGCSTGRLVSSLTVSQCYGIDSSSLIDNEKLWRKWLRIYWKEGDLLYVKKHTFRIVG